MPLEKENGRCTRLLDKSSWHPPFIYIGRRLAHIFVSVVFTLYLTLNQSASIHPRLPLVFLRSLTNPILAPIHLPCLRIKKSPAFLYRLPLKTVSKLAFCRLLPSSGDRCWDRWLENMEWYPSDGLKVARVFAVSMPPKSASLQESCWSRKLPPIRRTTALDNLAHHDNAAILIILFRCKANLAVARKSLAGVFWSRRLPACQRLLIGNGLPASSVAVRSAVYNRRQPLLVGISCAGYSWRAIAIASLALCCWIHLIPEDSSCAL